MKTEELLTILKKNKEIAFEELFCLNEEISFGELLNILIDSRGLTKAEVIKRTNIERTYFYQIINDKKLPGKDKVIECALAIGLDLDDTDRLLKLTNNGSLYPKIHRDAIIIYAINQKLDVYSTNELLMKYGFDILF